LDVDATHVLVDGKIVHNGDQSLIEQINENGFEQFLN
jgi:Fe-S cluster assembly ATP-binding protein